MSETSAPQVVQAPVGATAQQIKALTAPIDPSMVIWRPASSKIWNNCIQVLCYIDVRTVQDILDKAVGPENWKVALQPFPDGSGVMAGISILVNRGQTAEWVTKWDGADRKVVIKEKVSYTDRSGQQKQYDKETKIEGLPSMAIGQYGKAVSAVDVKGVVSDSIKRAGVAWGIARELYHVGETKVQVFQQYSPGAHYIKIDGNNCYWHDPDYNAVRQAAQNRQPYQPPMQNQQPQSQPQQQGNQQGSYYSQPASPPQGQQGYQQPQGQQRPQGNFDTSRDLVCPKCHEKRMVPSNRGTGYFCHGCRRSSTEQEYQMSITGGQGAPPQQPGGGQQPQQYDEVGPLDGSGIPQIDTSEVPF